MAFDRASSIAMEELELKPFKGSCKPIAVEGPQKP
jgi:hypothetical protein